MIAEPSRGTEARWTAGFPGCPGGASARVERASQLTVTTDANSDVQTRLDRAHAWGLDLSGTTTGAGGVVGLLLTAHHTPQAGGGTQVQTLAPLYDFNGTQGDWREPRKTAAGWPEAETSVGRERVNCSVLAFAEVATGQLTHRFDYDPFGNELTQDPLLSTTQTTPAQLPSHRFSTKYTDEETGLVYYGYRYFSPGLGRWLSRDPIEEQGGLNLYGVVGNDAINQVDVLGMARRGRCNRNRCPWEGPGGPTGTSRRLPDYNPGDSDKWSNLEEIIDKLFGGEEAWARARERRRVAACHAELAKLTIDDLLCMRCCTVLVNNISCPIKADLHDRDCSEIGKDGYFTRPGNGVVEYRI
jgi:RHS repeat-associated protein